MSKRQPTHEDLQALLDVAAWQQAQIERLANERDELIEIISRTGKTITELRRDLKKALTSPRYKDTDILPGGLSAIEARAKIDRIREMI